MANQIKVEVAYALPERQTVIAVKIAKGSTIDMAIHASGILETCTEIEMATISVGVYGQPRSLFDEVKDGERIEIYRPLTQDPKEKRRHKARG